MARRAPVLLTLPALLLALLAAACGSDDPKALTDEGYVCLNEGDPRGAQGRFQEALAQLAPTDPGYLRAALGRCEALARIDPKNAQASFLELAAAGLVREDDYSWMCDKLLSAGANLQAVEVMDAGNKAYPGSERMKLTVAAVRKASERAGDSEALRRLAGLGYGGGGG